MINGHGDDLYSYPDIRINFSSNVYNHFSHEGLYAHLASRMSVVASYPAPVAGEVEQMLATRFRLSSDEVMVTSGATEAIYLVAQALRGSCSAILSPTFSEYADACRIHAHRIRLVGSLAEVPNDAECVWLCNPNNPTGTVIPLADLMEAVGSRPKVLFVVDASYAPFTAEALLSPTEGAALPNVVMLHSLTKEFAIPGLRIGYITASADLLRRFRSLQMPWSVNALAQEAARYLLRHRSGYRVPLDLLLSERRRVAGALQQTGYIDVHRSDSHMLLCRLQRGTAAQLKQRLAQEHGILIRDASNFAGLSQGHFRIAVQTRKENDELLLSIRKMYDEV